MKPTYKKFKKYADVCLWILGRKGRTTLIYGAFLQVLISALDILFLALISPLIFLLTSTSQTNVNSVTLGRLELSTNEILFLILCVTSIKSILSLAVQKFLLNKLALREAEVITAFIHASLFENIENTKSNRSVDLIQTVNSLISMLFTNIFKPSVTFVGDLTTLIAVLLALAIYRPSIAAVTIIYLAVAGYLVAKKIGAKQKKLGLEILNFDRAAAHTFGEIRLIGLQLRFSNRESLLLTKFFKFKLDFANKKSSSFLFFQAPKYVMEFFLVSGIVLMFLVATSVGKLDSLLVTLGLFIAAGYRILPSINSTVNSITSYKLSMPLITRIGEIGVRFNLRNKALTFNADQQEPPNFVFDGDLVFDNVSYKYEGSQRNVIEKFNGRIPHKSVTVIQGANGSGKTTLISLALGLLIPKAGDVYMQINDTRVSMTERISGVQYVSQEVGFLDESIGYNIALRPISELDTIKLIEVCSRVGILERIYSSENGFDELVGENGGKLSAGERQRIGIARALFDSPSLLILDEPTSNLDSEAENEVWSALQNLKGEVTMLIVSHRKVPDELYDRKIHLNIFEPHNNKNFK